MKRILLVIVSVIVSVVMNAQTADFKKAVSKYKNVASLTATVTRVTHKDAVAKDKTVSGALYVKKPDKVAIVNGKDALIMNGFAFTMKKGILKAKTDAKTDSRYKTFHDVLESIFNGGTDLSGNKDVKMTKNSSNVILTITPSSTKKMMFSSYIVTIDTKSQELRSIRLNQKSGYTEYTFSGYKLGASVNDTQFK